MNKENLLLPYIPLRNLVPFPNVVFPFIVGRPKSLVALNSVDAKSGLIFLSVQKDGANAEPEMKDMEPIGVIAKVLKEKIEFDNTTKVLVKASDRAVLKKIVREEPYFEVEIEKIPFTGEFTNECKAVTKEISAVFEKMVHLIGPAGFDEDIIERIKMETNPVDLAFTIAFQLPVPFEDKQKLLSVKSLKEFLNKLLIYVNQEFEITEIQSKIRENVKKKLDETQKKIILSQELESIKKELDTLEGQAGEIEDLKAKVKGSGMTGDAMTKAMKEIEKLEYTPNYSPEYTVILNYLDWLISLPWTSASEENKDLKKASSILEKDHWGLDKIKKRIVEILAVRQLSESKKGPVLCFVGPPGVGKTSLGKSIARAMSRKFVRVSLGGIRDEAEIRGHRRTYIGALPGKIIQTMKRAGVRNPVFLMDEIDKLSADFRGDPASALLEALDPEQNFMFEDHYLDAEYDLSGVFFITTANNFYQIPEPLRDRMEVIFLSGYTSLEKYHIAKNYLVPRQISENGLKPEEVKFSKDSIMKIIENYTLESGVRSLERQIGKILRKIATKIVMDGRDKAKFPFEIGPDELKEYLGVDEYRSGKLLKKDIRGVVNGLAWTSYGGVILSIETILTPGTGKIQITGHVGKVMQESAQIAVSYIKANHKTLGVDPEKFKKNELHIHIPEGAIPKDGPSAGIAIATSVLSAFTGRTVPWNRAMTGELTLTGKVLPIGGLKEKLLAALRSGISTVYIPEDNKKSLSEIPAEITKKLKIKTVSGIGALWEEVFPVKK